MKKGSTASKTLLIDCQVFQTPSWDRGMGKYSFAFLKQLLAEKVSPEEYSEIAYIFNANLPENKEVLETILAHSDKSAILNLDLAVPKEPRTEYSVAPIIKINKSMLSEFVTEKFKDVVVDFLICALYLDEVCSVFPEGVSQKLLIYYDSIPYLYHERYGQFKGFFDNFYMPHTATVYEADKLLTISKTVANDLHVIFGIPKDCIFNIDGAPIPRQIRASSRPEFLRGKPVYALMPTGQELRKNNTRAVRAFEQFRTRNNLDLYLVITSRFTEEAKQELGAISSHVIFSGNVSEEEILWLFKNAQFVVFPSEYEGLGLPILEAAEERRLIACSDISVFREMSTTLFHYFSPFNVDEMADVIEKTYEHSLKEPTKDYKSLLQKYTWRHCVEHFIAAVKADQPEKDPVKKKKIAVFCPDPSGFSAIGKVVTESHAWYSRFFDITYYFDRGPNHEKVRPNPLPYLAVCRDAEDFSSDDYDSFDAVIYHVGNSEYHLKIIHCALARPGYVILHDTYLTGAYTNLREQGYISQQRFDLEKSLNAGEKDTTSLFLTSLVNFQKAVVVHSDYAARAVTEQLTKESGTLVKKINLPVDTPIYLDIIRGRQDRPSISFAGIIAKVKGTDIIEDIAQSDQFLDSNIAIFGYSAVEPERLEKLRSLPNVELVTNPNDYTFQNLMAKTDILVNVRLAYRGETSLTTLEAMRYGDVVLVRNFGWYAELPSDSVVKVPAPEAAMQALREVLEDKGKTELIRKSAIDYIETQHSHEAYAKDMYALID